MHARPTPGRRSFDRRLYSWFAILATLVVFAGFARTFYLQGVFHGKALSALLVAHGVIMTAWFVLFIVQVRLVAAGRVDLHRRLGKFGAALVGLILVVGVTTAIDAGRRGVTPDPGVTPLMFMAIPMVDLFMFATFIGLALWHRRRTDMHKRLMLLGTVSILTPGIARLPLPFIEQGSLPVFFGLTIACALVCIAVDTLRNRRLHPVFGWGCAFLIASVPLRILLAGSDVWTRFASWLVG